MFIIIIKILAWIKFYFILHICTYVWLYMYLYAFIIYFEIISIIYIIFLYFYIHYYVIITWKGWKIHFDDPDGARLSMLMMYLLSSEEKIYTNDATKLTSQIYDILEKNEKTSLWLIINFCVDWQKSITFCSVF